MMAKVRAAVLAAVCLVALIIAPAAAVAQHAICYYTQFDGGFCYGGEQYLVWECAGGGFYTQPDGPCIVA